MAINKNITPVLTLIGAGPGDPDLITVKGMIALTTAKVILYDALVSTELLNYAPKNCINVFVGKRSGQHSYRQEDINDLIVKYAFENGSVVRLKGGDPFVFGRGGEEIEHAAKFGIECEIIPGLSSSTSLTALQSIPITKRNINESFWVINGTLKSGEISSDFYLAARSNATVVILMGRKKLNKIVGFYKSIGKENMAIAIIQNGSLPNEKIVIGTIETIEEQAENNEIGTPAILVIGEVVKQHKSFELVEKYSKIAI